MTAASSIGTFFSLQGWHPENPARGIYPKNPGGIFGINGPGIKGIFRDFWDKWSNR